MVRFQTTRWSLIEAAATAPHPLARPTLEALCQAYRPPVLAYIRRAGYRGADAEDLSQAFFLGLLERGWHARADPARGRFRALVLTSLRHFLADQAAHARTRGPAWADAGSEPLDRVSGGDSPEHAFTRAWLGVLLERAVVRLQREWQAAGRQAEFDRIGPLLLEEADPGQLQQLAAQLGMRTNTLAVRLHRMRSRLRQLARLELLQTVDGTDALEEELAELRGALDASP
jgi:RNA polymerase sigma-70 factor (ECF subfamily)